MAAAEPQVPQTWTQRLFNPKTLAAVAAGLTLGTLIAAGGWWFWLKPQRDVARLRYETMMDVSTLFGLQRHFKEVKGVYAPDLDTLLTLSPDRDAFKARMAGHLDLTTIAVVGSTDAFKIEANVLDPDRTLIRIKGPIENAYNYAPTSLPQQAPQMDTDGAPINPGR